MNPVWIAFGCGWIIGAAMGVIIVSLCVISGRNR